MFQVYLYLIWTFQHIYIDCGLGISEHYEETKEPAARDPRLQPRPYKMYQ